MHGSRASPIIPAHTRYPGVGDVPVFLSDQFVALLSLLFPLLIKFLSATPLFPLLTQKQGGVHPQKCRRADIFSLFSLNPHSRPSCFSITCALFHFPYPTYLPPFQYLPHSCPENRGYTPSGPTNPSVPLPPFLPFPPFTAHSQICYRPFTHRSPCLVTMNPGPGSNTNTMSIAISPRTVHFYQCDPLREIPS